MLRAALNKSWIDHLSNAELYGNIPRVTATIRQQKLRFAGHCWPSKNELSSEVLLWEPSHGKQLDTGKQIGLLQLNWHWLMHDEPTSSTGTLLVENDITFEFAGGLCMVILVYLEICGDLCSASMFQKSINPLSSIKWWGLWARWVPWSPPISSACKSDCFVRVCLFACFFSR